MVDFPGSELADTRFGPGCLVPAFQVDRAIASLLSSSGKSRPSRVLLTDKTVLPVSFCDDSSKFIKIRRFVKINTKKLSPPSKELESEID